MEEVRVVPGIKIPEDYPQGHTKRAFYEDQIRSARDIMRFKPYEKREVKKDKDDRMHEL